MLRDGPRGPSPDRHEEPGPGRRRGAQLRRQRPAAARGAVRRHLDSAGGGRRRRRAGRGAVRLASAAGQAARSRRPGPPEGQPARAALHVGRDVRVSRRHRRAVPARGERSGSAGRGRRSAGAGQDRRLVPGPDGVRAAGARRAQHPRRSAVAGDAGDDEPEDQVPRELPALRADRAARRGARVVRHRPEAREPVHAAGRAGARGASRAADRRAARDDADAIPTCGSGSTSCAPRCRR